MLAIDTSASVTETSMFILMSFTPGLSLWNAIGESQRNVIKVNAAILI